MSESPAEGSERSLLNDIEPLEAIGWLLLGGGALTAATTLVKGRRSLLDWLVPMTLLAAGGNVLMARRRSRIDTAGERILAELNTLDPIARAQVLKSVAQEELSKLPGLGSSGGSSGGSSESSSG